MTYIDQARNELQSMMGYFQLTSRSREIQLEMAALIEDLYIADILTRLEFHMFMRQVA